MDLIGEQSHVLTIQARTKRISRPREWKAKKSNDNYGPKIKLFICVPAAHISARLPCRIDGGGECTSEPIYKSDECKEEGESEMERKRKRSKI